MRPSLLVLEIDVGQRLPGWRRCDKDAARPTDTSGVLLISGLEAPACLRESLAPAVIDIAVGAGRAASSADQGGGKRRLDI